jgi:hypothetical protein
VYTLASGTIFLQHVACQRSATPPPRSNVETMYWLQQLAA